MKNKKIVSFSIACLFGMLLTTNVVADNLSDKHVYSFFTENFNGAAVDASRAYDNMGISVWNGGGDAYPQFPDGTNTPLIEGTKHYSFSVTGGGGWSGWCYTFKDASNTATTKNISSFSTLEFYIRPKTGDVSNIGFGLTDASSDKTKTLSSLGVVNSNKNWQKVSVSLSSFGADLTQVKNIFLFITSNVTATFDVDYMVMKKSTMGAFDATLKNISDNSSATQITWAQSVFRTSWKAAEQYVDLSLDTLTNDSWKIKIYTNNGASNKSGLVDTTSGTSILPMCWRIHKQSIPCEGCTLSIAQGGAPNYGLYDSGVSSSDPGYYPWFYFVDKSDSEIESSKADYVIIWSYKGFHGASGNYYGMSDMIPTGVYPKLYFGADFSNALGGLTYNSSIRLELTYE